MKIKSIYLLMPLQLLILISIYSCKEKGCTDPAAINYNSVADDDDGTCIYCKSQTDITDLIMQNLMDNSGSGPHPFQNVAEFTIYQYKSGYNNSVCGSNTCYFMVYAKSLVTETMTFSYSLQVNGSVSFSRFRSATLPGFQTTFVDSVPSNVVSNPCGSLSNSSIFLSPSGTIFYH